MRVQHDMVSQTTQRHLRINSTNYTKSNEKLTSGYRINRAADDAAGLNILENMRFMIRGLRRGAQNAEDGIDFICTGDSAMSEIEAMLHRMRELAVQSINDTSTGKLSYLIYGRYDGGSYGSLPGTTAFTNEYPLGITPENDTITFYMQSLTGLIMH